MDCRYQASYVRELHPAGGVHGLFDRWQGKASQQYQGHHGQDEDSQ